MYPNIQLPNLRDPIGEDVRRKLLGDDGVEEEAAPHKCYGACRRVEVLMLVCQYHRFSFDYSLFLTIKTRGCGTYLQVVDVWASARDVERLEWLHQKIRTACIRHCHYLIRRSNYADVLLKLCRAKYLLYLGPSESFHRL